MRAALRGAYAAIVEADAAERPVAVADDALEALLEPGAVTWISGERGEVLDLFGLLVLRLAESDAVLVVCGGETPALVAGRWLHARARVPRATPVSREGWQRLAIEAGPLAEREVSFVDALTDAAPTPRAVFVLGDAPTASIDGFSAVGASVIVATAAARSLRAGRRAWIERVDDTVRALRVVVGTEERSTDLYYEGASGFFARLDTG